MKNKPGGKMSIVMLANGHPPFDTRIFIKEARTLAAAGYAVSIILPHKQNEEKDGVRILSVKPFINGFQKLFISPWRILIKALAQPAGSVFCIHDSDILWIGFVLKLLGRKVIYDAHEDTPLQISYQHWLPNFAKKPYAWLYYVIEKWVGILFDRIIVAEPVIAKYFPAHKTHLIRNFPGVDSFFKSSSVIKPYEARAIRLVSVGTLSKVRGLFEMLEGAKLAYQKIDFEFTLGGAFAPTSLEKQVRDSYNFNLLSWVSFNDLVKLLFDSRIGIIIPHPIPRYKTNYPVKLFEFMAAGIPVIVSREGESSKFVEEANCGIMVDPLNVNEICEAIVWLLSNSEKAEAMGKRGQRLILKKYNWENESKTLLHVYADLFK